MFSGVVIVDPGENYPHLVYVIKCYAKSQQKTNMNNRTINLLDLQTIISL